MIGQDWINASKIRTLQNANQNVAFAIARENDDKLDTEGNTVATLQQYDHFVVNVSFFACSAELLRNPLAMLAVSDVRMSKSGELKVGHNGSQVTFKTSGLAGRSEPVASYLLCDDFRKTMALGR